MNTVSPDNIAHDYSFFFYYLFETILFCFFLLSLRGEKYYYPLLPLFKIFNSLPLVEKHKIKKGPNK
jgi:Trk-type K+ transport system membrane component